MAAAARPLPAAPAPVPVGAYDRAFYGGMAIALALIALAGFAPTYYLRLFDGGPKATLSGRPFTTLVHVHAALFTAWVALFAVQTALVAGRRVALHRRLGVAGAVLAAAMVAAGLAAAVASAAGGAAPPGMDPLAFLVIPVFDMVLFAGFVAAALAKRRDKEAHKRLMLMAYISIMVAAVARLPGVLALGPLGFFALAYLLTGAGVIYDLASRGRVHRVYMWGSAVLVASVPARLALSGTSAWRTLAEWMTR